MSHPLPTSNKAAWLVAEKAHPFEIKQHPVSAPGPDELLVRNHALSIPPFTGYCQKLAFIPLAYPTILGEDIAGEVVSVGSAVTRFKPGDRVTGLAMGLAAKHLSETAFQEHTIVHEANAALVPDSVDYAPAAVLPLALSTAAPGMFLPAPMLGLSWPQIPFAKPQGKTLLVWGGASTVGSNAIQLARAAGYDVVSTASAANFAYVEGLGAERVFDYKAEGVVGELVAFLRHKDIAGVLDCVGAHEECVAVLKELKGSKVVATTKPPKNVEEQHGVALRHVQGFGMTFAPLGQHIFELVEKGLKDGSYVVAPEPQIVGHGIEYVQEAVDLVFPKGVSAKRLVVTL